MVRWNAAATAALLALVALSGSEWALAQAERDLQGARAAGAETAMQSRGYSVARTRGLDQYWWNAGSSTCVHTRTENGRYAKVEQVSDGDCGHGGGKNDDAATAVAAVAAVGLIAALAHHNKHKHDHSGTQDHDAEYSRGYNDGLYGAAYGQTDSEAYHDGYIAGETEAGNRRAVNTSYMRRNAPYAQRACEARADAFQNVPPGTSTAINVSKVSGDDYQVVVASGQYRSRCVASTQGVVRSIDPY